MTINVTTTMNPIDVIKKDIVDYINAQPYFQGINCIWDEAGDVDTQILARVNAIGIGILVECVKGKVEFKAVGSQAMEMTVTITIEENVMVNRDPGNASASGKKATDILCELFALFNPIEAAQRGEGLPFTVDDYDLVRNTGGRIIYQITGTAKAGWKLKQ